MAAEVTREHLERILLEWQRGELSLQQVHLEAERLMDAWGWPTYARDDPRSTVVEALARLEALNHHLITEADVPAMLAFVAGPPHIAWPRWEAYWTDLDWEARRRQLAGHRYYCA